MNLLGLPIDVLDEVVHNIEKPADVLRLGLTCKLMLSLTVPSPLLYRNLLWPDDDRTVFTSILDMHSSGLNANDRTPSGELSEICAHHLVEEPRRAKAVRSLGVLAEPATSVPIFLVDLLRRTDWASFVAKSSHVTTREEDRTRNRAFLTLSQITLARTLEHMRYLQNFTWDWEDPDAEGPLWDPLSRLSFLSTARFSMTDDLTPRGRDRFGTPPDAVLQRIASTAEYWPSLKSLNIEVNFSYYDSEPGDDDEGFLYGCSWNASPFLRGRFPQLRELELRRARGSVEDVANFFRAHSLIEKLVFNSWICLHETAFPIEQTGGIGEPFLNRLDCGPYRPITFLAVAITSVEQQEQFHRLLPGLAGTLKRLQVEGSLHHLEHAPDQTSDCIRWILGAVPRLTHLTVPEQDISESVQEKSPLFLHTQVPQIELWARYFVLSCNLETLSLTLGNGRTSQYLPQDDIEEIKRQPTVNLECVFLRIAPELRVTSVTCSPHEKLEITCSRGEVRGTVA